MHYKRNLTHPAASLQGSADGQSAAVHLDELRLKSGLAQIVFYSGARLVIEGHADDVGSDRYNFRLSYRRARAVANIFSRPALSAPASSTRVRSSSALSLSIIYGILRNHNDAEDIAQQVADRLVVVRNQDRAAFESRHTLPFGTATSRATQQCRSIRAGVYYTAA